MFESSTSSKTSDLRIAGRDDFLIIAAATGLIGGLLFPLSGYIYDIVIVFCLCLTAVTLLITVRAKNASDASGFGVLIVTAGTLHMAMSTALAKLILMRDDAGFIVEKFGGLAVRKNYFLAFVLFCFTSAILLYAIWRSVRCIIRYAGEFISHSAPAKQLDIDNDFNAGTLTMEQAEKKSAGNRPRIRLFYGDKRNSEVFPLYGNS